MNNTTHKVQIVRTAPLKVFKEVYLTPKGQRLAADPNTTQGELEKYRKNRYSINPESKVLKEWINGKLVPAKRYFGVKLNP